MRFVRIASFRILVLGVALVGIATAAFVTAATAMNELLRKWTLRIRSAGKGAEGASPPARTRH